MTYMKAWMSLKFGQIRLLVSMATDRVLIKKNSVATFSRVFFTGSFLHLQVMMTCMRAWRISKFGQIRLLTWELAALERLKKNPDRLIMGKTLLPHFLGCFRLDPFHTCR